MEPALFLAAMTLAVDLTLWLLLQRWPALRGAAVSLPTLGLASFGAYLYLAPLPATVSAGVPGTVVLDSSGVILQRDSREGLRIPVELDQVAPAVIDATIAAEDRRFRSHPGIDPLATLSAVVSMPVRRSGASTITQQLARRTYIEPGGPVLARKAKEAILALRIEAHMSKDEVLERYLNDVYYGRGAYGIEAAARVYFGVSAKNLDLAQASLLAGLPQSPGLYGEEPLGKAARARQAYVLSGMVKTGDTSPAEALAALEQPLTLAGADPAIAPHFIQYVRDELARLRPDLAGRSELIIETTLDAGLQREAEAIVRYQLQRLQAKEAGNAAVVVIDPRDGSLLTMVGSADFAADGGQINMTVQPRQPGSALKPFLYAAALDRGYTAATPLLDTPVSFDMATGPYAPLNADRQFHGVVPLRVALASSYNIPAVRTLADIGIDALLTTAHRFGLDTLTDAEVYGLALTLGGGEVRLLDLSAAYGAFMNEGRLAKPFAIARVRDSSGRVLYERESPDPAVVVAAEIAYVIADILSDAEARIPGFGASNPLALPFPAAVKTGTTTGFRDNWTVGATAERVVGVWVGNTDNRPMRDISGVDGAGPTWRQVMEVAMRDVRPSWPESPSGLTRATVCAPTGLRPGPSCPAPTEEWFIAGTEPKATETYYSAGPGGVAVAPPTEARAWATDARLPIALSAAGDESRVHILSPESGALMYLSPELGRQETLLRASAPAGATRVDFRIDGRLAGTATGDRAEVVWPLEAGVHELEVIAYLADGRTVVGTSRFEVRSR